MHAVEKVLGENRKEVYQKEGEEYGWQPFRQKAVQVVLFCEKTREQPVAGEKEEQSCTEEACVIKQTDRADGIHAVAGDLLCHMMQDDSDCSHSLDLTALIGA